MFPTLYAITHSAWMPGKALVTKTEAALKGGCRLVQYRDKSGDQSRRRREAKCLLDLCRDFGAQLVINDDIELAASLGAQGVHLGQGDAPLELARERLGPQALVGITCHDRIDLAQTALASGANYVAFGRFFSSQTKPHASAATLDLLTKARDLAAPCVAIGGVNLDNAAALYAAGASCLATSESLFRQSDLAAITACCEKWLAIAAQYR